MCLKHGFNTLTIGKEKIMENTVIEQGNVTGNVEETQEKTFTQAELDEIIKSRIAKERAKYGDYEVLQQKASKFDEMEEASKSELQKATERAEALQKQIDAMNRANEVRNAREKVANETGVPANLLTGETEEDCLEQANAILAYKNDSQSRYPSVKDGGEVQSGTHKKDVAGQFADWFNASLNN